MHRRQRRTPAQHVAHHGHRLLIWLGSIAGIVILVAIAGIWRLLQGPVELDRLVPYVEQALQQSGAGIGVAVTGVSIGLDRETHQLDLQAQNVSLSLPSGEKLASFPEMATSFSLGAMLGGRIEPTRIVVEHPTVALTRDESGSFSFRVGNLDAASDQFGLANALGIFAPQQQGTPWARLRRIEIRDAAIIVDDRLTGKIWRADRAAATLVRDRDGVTGDLSFAVKLDNGAPELHAKYRFAAATQTLDVQLALGGLDPTALAPLSPALAPLAQIGLQVAGTADLRVNLATGCAESAKLDLSLGEGQIRTDLLASGKLPVAKGELHADYASDAAELRLEKLALDLHDGTILTIDGKLGGVQPQLISAGADLPAALAGSLDVTLTHVPVGRADALWPRGVSPGGRKWIAANLSDGQLDEMTARLAVKFDPYAMTADFGDVHATMRYHDLTVDYFNGLPPAKKVSGTATLNDRRLDFAIAGGVLKSLKATGGTMSITNIGPGIETLTVDVGVAGGVQDALETIDSKPLRYAHEAGVDPTRVGGKVDAQLHFQLPLLAALKLADVDYGAKATLNGVSYSKVAFDKPLTDGNFTLDLGHDGVHAKGTGKFDGSSATIDGNLYFHAKSGPRALYKIGLALDDAARQRLGWDFLTDRLSGPIGIDVTYTLPANSNRAEVVAQLDLAAASLICEEASWKKPPQTPGTAKLVVALNDDVVLGIPAIDIKAAGLDARFAVAVSPDDRHVERVDIRHLTVGNNELAGTVSRRIGGGWTADIRGQRLDLHHALKHALEDDAPPNPMPLAINARVTRLLLGPHREMRDVTATLLRERGGWQSMRIDGGFTNGHRLELTLGGAEPGGHRLRYQSDDLGATFALFGIADNVVGGKLSIDGTMSEIAGGHHQIQARIDGSDYRLARAPTVAKLLSLTSLDGIASMLAGDGIPFMTLRGDVSFSRGVIAVHRLITYGGAIGVSVEGWLNPGEDRLDIDGTLAPAYALNSVLSNFPVLGPLLMGGEGQGLFAASFRLSGSSDYPTVTVNPLSALTPGLLRHLFDPFTAAAPPDAPQQAAQPVAPSPQRDAGH